MPNLRSASPLVLDNASNLDLLRYIEEDIASIRFRMETGRYPDGVVYDAGDPAVLIAVYAAELIRRGY